MDKTPDQIRRATVPVKHSALGNAILAAALGAAVWFGGWALLHKEQARHYKQYVQLARQVRPRKAGTEATAKKQADRATAILCYALLRYGNEDHTLDAQLIRLGWYPKGENAAAWIASHAGVVSVYDGQGPMRVIAWPLGLFVVTLFGGLMWGFVSDARYRSRLIVGIPFDGSIVATVGEYNEEVKGDGMKYAVKAWRDR